MSETTGLTTNKLQDGVVNQGVELVQHTDKSNNETVFEIASDIDNRAKEFMKILEENDKDIDARINKISTALESIRKSS